MQAVQAAYGQLYLMLTGQEAFMPELCNGLVRELETLRQTSGAAWLALAKVRRSARGVPRCAALRRTPLWCRAPHPHGTKGSESSKEREGLASSYVTQNLPRPARDRGRCAGPAGRGAAAGAPRPCAQEGSTEFLCGGDCAQLGPVPCERRGTGQRGG